MVAESPGRGWVNKRGQEAELPAWAAALRRAISDSVCWLQAACHSRSVMPWGRGLEGTAAVCVAGGAGDKARRGLFGQSRDTGTWGKDKRLCAQVDEHTTRKFAS